MHEYKKILVVEIAMFGIKTNNRKRFKNNKPPYTCNAKQIHKCSKLSMGQTI